MRLLYLHISWWIFIGISALIILLPVSLISQTAIQQPHEIFSSEMIARWEDQLQTDPNSASQVAQEVRQNLNRYYEQFVDDKRIADQKYYQAFDPLNKDLNITRLVASAHQRKKIAPWFLGDSPYLQRIYIVLGDAYKIQNDTAHALWSWSMALRYGRREVPPVKNATRTDIEISFILMHKSWSNPQRLLEENDPNQRQAAESFNQKLEAYHKAILDCERFQKDVYAREAELARSNGSRADVDDARTRRDSTCQSKETLYMDLERIHSGPYRAYLSNKNDQEARVAYQMALAVRDIETENFRRNLKKNEGSFLRAAGDIRAKNKTRMRGYTGYTQLLELAHFLHPTNPEYVRLLALEEQRSGRWTQAIAWQLQFIKLADAQQKQLLQEHKAYIVLSQLYESNREYLQSAHALEEHFKIKDPDAKSEKDALRLADLHFKYTGNFKRALELYLEQIQMTKDKPAEQADELEAWIQQTQKYAIHVKTSHIYNKFNDPPNEEAQLLEAVKIYRNLEATRSQIKDAKLEIISKINSLKKQLLNSQDDELQKQYYILLQNDKPQVELRLNTIHRRISQLHHATTLEKLIPLYWQKKEFRRVQGLMREIIEIGNSRQASLARRNLDLIEKILADEIIRPLYVK